MCIKFFHLFFLPSPLLRHFDLSLLSPGDLRNLLRLLHLLLLHLLQPLVLLKQRKRDFLLILLLFVGLYKPAFATLASIKESETRLGAHMIGLVLSDVKQVAWLCASLFISLTLVRAVAVRKH